MPSMNYNSLLADMKRYLERGGVTDTEVYAQMPMLITLTERDIATKLKILGFLVPSTTTLTVGLAVYPKPDRWRETASINIGTGEDLEERVDIFPRSYEYCNAYWPNRTLRDQPEFYADYDYAHWLIVPTPVLAYPMEVNYWEFPAPLSSSNQTNWLTDYAPGALTFGTLLQAAPFLKDDGRIQTMAAQYQDALASLDGEDLQRILDRTVTRQEV